MTIQIEELKQLIVEINQDNNDDDASFIASIQDNIENLQIKSNGVMVDFADCCFDQEDEISRHKQQIHQLTQQVEKYQSDHAEFEDESALCKNLIISIEEISNDYNEMINDDFVQSGQMANLYEQISMFMLDASQKTSFIPNAFNSQTTQIGVQIGNNRKSEIRRKSVIPEASLQEIKQALQDKGQDTENKLVGLVQKICDEMEDKHGKQIDDLHKTNDDAFTKMKAMMAELNMYKYTNQHLSPVKVRNNYKKFAMILFSSWIILGGIFAKYHFYVIAQLKAQYEAERNQISKFMINTAPQSIVSNGSLLIPLVIGILITIGLTKFGVDVFGVAWNFCKLCWSGIKWFFQMILPENIYVMVFEFGEKKRWKRRGSTGRLASYEQDTVRVKKVRVRGK